MPLVSGATAAGFTIVRLLGRGEIGELYLAEHPRLPRQLALKLLSEDVSADAEYRRRFKRESDLAATLWHPHIVGLHDRGKFEGQLWLSMDYVDGADAIQVLSDTYPDGMPPGEVIKIVSAIADALDYAHDHGLVHRYVNPSNILLTKSASDRRRIRLAGFGIARRLDDTNSLIRPNQIVGTASYGAPEQLPDELIDGRADQYGLAATAFHLLTGSPPFAHINPAVLTNKQLNEPPPRPSRLRPELSRFDEIFAHALAKAPGDRFRRCQEFAEALAENDGKGFHPDALATAVLPMPKAKHAAPDESAAPVAAAEFDDAGISPDALPDTDVDKRPVAEPATSEADDPSTARRPRLLHTAALVLTITAVALLGSWGVVALRSASVSEQTPTTIEPPSSATPIPPPPAAPARATTPPISIAPPPVPSIPPTRIASSAVTTTSPPSSPSLRETTRQTTVRPTTRTTTTSPSPPSTTSVAGLDTRPALGQPCGPEQAGAANTSNSGIPVSCVSTPGGFAWQPAGG